MKKNENRNISGIIGQWVGMVMVICGILIEVSMGAEIGFAAITAGSLVWAIATKIRRK